MVRVIVKGKIEIFLVLCSHVGLRSLKISDFSETLEY